MGMKCSFTLLQIALLIASALGADPCSPRQGTHDSVYCVCTEDYCDTLDPIEVTPLGTVQIFESSQAGKRLDKRTQDFNGPENPDGTPWTVTIDRTTTFQEIIGFGGAYSDAAAVAIGNLSPNLQDKLMRSYYSTNGIEYSTGRVVISGSDFSNRPYTYDDVVDDYDLVSFSLVDEDLTYKIPLIKTAQSLSPYTIKLFASSWSPPAWLKTPPPPDYNPLGSGTLLGEAGSIYWETYAKYLVRFFQEYENNGVTFWGMTIQNEPETGFDYWFPWNTCGFSPEMERDFVKVDLYHNLQEAGYDYLKLMTLDHNRDLIPDWANTVLSDPDANPLYAGLALHWYYYAQHDNGPEVYDDFVRNYPNHFILATEACNVDSNDTTGLGNWTLAENYAHDILTDITHSVSGWTDWNLALDTTGGFNWANNPQSSPIIANAAAGEFYKNTQYYAMGHFSKFISPGTKRIATNPQYVTDSDPDQFGDKFDLGVFLRPDNGIVVVAVNSHNEPQAVTLVDDDQNRGQIKIQVEPRSFSSWLYY